MRNTKNEIKASLFILLINLVGVAILYAFYFLKTYFENVILFWQILVAYVLISLVITLISKRFKNQILKQIQEIITFPFSLFSAIVFAFTPALITQLYLVLYLLLSFAVPSYLYILDKKFSLISLNLETWVYIISSSGVIIATVFHRQLEVLTFKMLLFTSQKKDKEKRAELVNLCNYIVSKSNIKLVIYALYFIALIIFNFLTFQNSSFFTSHNFDNSILQSFITFLAFDQITTNLKLTEFKPSGLLEIFFSAVKDEMKGKSR